MADILHNLLKRLLAKPINKHNFSTCSTSFEMVNVGVCGMRNPKCYDYGYSGICISCYGWLEPPTCQQCRSNFVVIDGYCQSCVNDRNNCVNKDKCYDCNATRLNCTVAEVENSTTPVISPNEQGSSCFLRVTASLLIHRYCCRDKMERE